MDFIGNYLIVCLASWWQLVNWWLFSEPFIDNWCEVVSQIWSRTFVRCLFMITTAKVACTTTWKPRVVLCASSCISHTRPSHGLHTSTPLSAVTISHYVLAATHLPTPKGCKPELSTWQSRELNLGPLTWIRSDGLRGDDLIHSATQFEF